jgi:hypothetical protein
MRFLQDTDDLIWITMCAGSKLSTVGSERSHPQYRFPKAEVDSTSLVSRVTISKPIADLLWFSKITGSDPKSQSNLVMTVYQSVVSASIDSCWIDPVHEPDASMELVDNRSMHRAVCPGKCLQLHPTTESPVS